MLIQGGELVMGTLCKKTLGASGGSLIHVIWMEEGPEAARAFLSQTQYLVNHWLLQHGFSIGIGDTVADAATMLIISDIINKARLCLGQVLDLNIGCAGYSVALARIIVVAARKGLVHLKLNLILRCISAHVPAVLSD